MWEKSGSYFILVKRSGEEETKGDKWIDDDYKIL